MRRRTGEPAPRDSAHILPSVRRLEAGEAVRVAGVLFDMDGTLIDSISAVEQSWRLWAEEFGIPVPSAALHGRTAAAIVDALALPIDVRAHATRRLAEIESRPGQRLEPTPGSVALLRGLPPGRWGVVTSAARQVALTRLRAAGIAVPELLVTGEDTTRGKPAGEPFAQGVHALHERWGDEVVIALEDTVAGLVSARRAGCVAIGVPGTHEARQLTRRAHLMIPSLAGLVAAHHGTAHHGTALSIRVLPAASTAKSGLQR